jgi:hypothetical protein
MLITLIIGLMAGQRTALPELQTYFHVYFSGFGLSVCYFENQCHGESFTRLPVRLQILCSLGTLPT